MILQSYSEINSLHEIQVFVISRGSNIFGVGGEDETFFFPGPKGPSVSARMLIVANDCMKSAPVF